MGDADRERVLRAEADKLGLSLEQSGNGLWTLSDTEGANPVDRLTLDDVEVIVGDYARFKIRVVTAMAKRAAAR